MIARNLPCILNSTLIPILLAFASTLKENYELNTTYLYTIRAERIDMTVIHKIDPIQINHPQIRRRRLQLMHINNLVNLLLLLFNLFVRPDQMQNLQTIDEVVDLPHKSLHEDHLRQTNAQILELRREGLQLAKIVQLHGSRKIQQHVREIWALVGQLVENCVGDELYRKLYVAQGGAEADTDQG